MAFAPRSTKEVAYKILVRPKLEYAAPILSPYCKIQIQQVEKVQRTAARWTSRRWRNTSNVGEMLDELQWPPLEARMVGYGRVGYVRLGQGRAGQGRVVEDWRVGVARRGETRPVLFFATAFKQLALFSSGVLPETRLVLSL